jgi:hypothetical protein
MFEDSKKIACSSVQLTFSAEAVNDSQTKRTAFHLMHRKKKVREDGKSKIFNIL